MNKKNLDTLIVSPNSTIGSVVEKINQNGFRGVFICDGDKELIGIVMDSDIRRATLRNFGLDTSIRTIMKVSPFVINNEHSIAKRKEIFIKSSKILAPIVDKQNKVVDYIYLADILDDMIQHTTHPNDKILPPQRILLIGGAGYIGSVLYEKLIKMGYKVRILDLLLYGKESISKFDQNEEFDFIKGDCRDAKTIERALDGIDAVVHLGEIVGDPACAINESFTIETNYEATHQIVELCVKRGIKRLIFASSCSVYGKNDNAVDEESELNPVSLYARCKIESEKAIMSFKHDQFCPTIFRLSTVHGKSYRPRFDLVVNLLSIKALTEGKIQIFGGNQWRPFISVKDICNGMITCLHTESYKVKNQIFNLGDSRENYQLVTIGELLEKHMPEATVETLKDQEDDRDYKVNFDKIKSTLGFTTQHSIEDTIEELKEAFHNKEFNHYKDPKYHNVLTLSEN
jgi:nucleoside-diphosphate-sugar epimerase